MEPISDSRVISLHELILEKVKEFGNAERVVAVETRYEDDRAYCPNSYEIYRLIINGRVLHMEIYWDTDYYNIDYIDILEFSGYKVNIELNIAEDADDADYCHKLYWLNVATLCESLNIDYMLYLRFLPMELQYTD
jgi:hypothetical protein